VPEGDVIHRAARQLARLCGEPLEVVSARPELATLARALDGATLEAATARGKHLLLHFDGGRTLHSHLRMRGSWRVMPANAARPGGWLELHGRTLVAVQRNGPVLELLDPPRLALHPVLSRLGPDVLDPGFEPRAAVARLHAQVDGRISVADALLDQQVACGIGNVFKSESLHAERLHPWAAVGSLDDRALASLYDRAAVLMGASLQAGAARRANLVYRQRACGSCGGPVSSRAQGDDGRVTWWCAHCQPSG
jgi:endonuclease-8